MILSALVLAAALPVGLSCEEPAPGLSDRRVYYYVHEGLDLSARPGLFIFLHGGGDGMPDDAPAKYLSPTNGWLRPHIDTLPFIVAAPTAPRGHGDNWSWNHPEAIREVLAVIEAVDAKVPIDRDRIVLGGQSMGGFGAYHLGQVLADRLAGVWMAAGAWYSSDFRVLRGTSVFLQHGKYDCAPGWNRGEPAREQFKTGLAYARAADELMSRYGVDHVYSEYAGGHGLGWPAAQESTRRFAAWATAVRRQPYAPAAAVSSPCGSEKPTLVDVRRSRWLEAVAVEPGTVERDAVEIFDYESARDWAQYEAQSYRLAKRRFAGFRLEAFNRGGNRFEARAENVRAFRIYLAAPMGDLALPFVIDAGELGCQTQRAVAVTGECDYRAAIDFIAEDRTEPPVETLVWHPAATDDVLENPGMGIVCSRRVGEGDAAANMAMPSDAHDWFPGLSVVGFRLPAEFDRFDFITTYSRAWIARGRRFSLGVDAKTDDASLRRLAMRYDGSSDVAYVEVDEPERVEAVRRHFVHTPVLTPVCDNPQLAAEQAKGDPVLYAPEICGRTLAPKWWDEKPLFAGLEAHQASYFVIRGDPHLCHRNNEVNFGKIARRIGYRFELREVRVPSRLVIGESASIESTWVNVGLARRHAPSVVTYGLRDGQGRVAWLWTDEASDLRRLEPKLGGVERPLSLKSACVFGWKAHGQALPPGEYELTVSVGSPEGRVEIALPLAGGENRVYPLGKVRVTRK